MAIFETCECTILPRSYYTFIKEEKAEERIEKKFISNIPYLNDSQHSLQNALKLMKMWW